MEQKTLSKIHWLGHDGFRFDAEQIIYIDPYQISADHPKADIILITHEHYDHLSQEDIARIAQPATAFVAPASAAGQLQGDVHIVKPGDTITVKGIEIEVVPAYNVNKKFHPKSAGHVGYIVEVDGERVYHAGDTDLIPEMSDMQVDIALLPVSGTYVMTWDEAVEAAERLKPRLVIPMHYGSIVGDIGDARKCAAESPVETVLLPEE